MITRHPVSGESCRGFMVFSSKVAGVKVNSVSKRNRLRYEKFSSPNRHAPYLSGEEALELMTTLQSRGFDCVAYTKGNGNEENLTIEEMKALYD